MKVYIVTTGYYSDYSIHSVYTNKELAIEVMDTLPESNIEEYEVDIVPDYMNKIRNGYKVYYIQMKKDGTVRYMNECHPIEGECVMRLAVITPSIICLVGTIWAKSQEHALKIINEKRTMLIANGEWT